MNTIDFTKDEIRIICDNIKFLNGKGVESIGLWGPTVTAEELIKVQ